MKRAFHFGFPSVSFLTFLTISIGLGCSGSKRHDLLAFLFDGVPADTVAAPDSATASPPDSLSPSSPSASQAPPDSLRAAVSFVFHEPYAAGECVSCHNMPGGAGERGSGGAMPALPIGQASGSSWLVLPIEELCIGCHDDKSAEYAKANGLKIHGPVDAGECTACHHPHRSRYRNLMLTERARDLCFQCHEESLPEGFGGHPELADAEDCTDCHNPHLSSEDFFLK